jgi:hypothetical protein
MPLSQLNGNLHAVDRLNLVFELPPGPLPYFARVTDIRFGWGVLTNFKAVARRRPVGRSRSSTWPAAPSGDSNSVRDRPP